LFSNDQVARFVNQNFEAVWEMVREVPIVRIDFGGGNVLTRTLHGNILTTVCTADGKTLDALPGIYNPQGYLDQLDQFRLLAKNFLQQPPAARERWIRRYHESAVAAIKANQPPARFTETKKVVPVGKMVIERPTEAVIATGPPPPPPQVARPPIGKGFIENPVQKAIGQQFGGQFGQPVVGVPPAPAPVATPPPPAVPSAENVEELAGWKALAEDTKLNETTRRRQIHEMLAKAGLVAPGVVTKPIYKEVLHADLDDPYLGLGPTLFDSYPFTKEDAKR
jgi:hypothetical protein